MSRRWIGLVLTASLLCASGAHLAVLQTVAWARMAAGFSRTDGARDMLRKTFDGRHACDLCLKVRKASSAGKSLVAVRAEGKLDAIASPTSIRLVRKDIAWTLPSFAARSGGGPAAPDLPPPRSSPS